jgi:hypothetical protein
MAFQCQINVTYRAVKCQIDLHRFRSSPERVQHFQLSKLSPVLQVFAEQYVTARVNRCGNDQGVVKTEVVGEAQEHGAAVGFDCYGMNFIKHVVNINECPIIGLRRATEVLQKS